MAYRITNDSATSTTSMAAAMTAIRFRSERT
jgi:hypothetical protein